MSVYYRPARRKCLPVLAPAQAFVRAGVRRGEKCGIGARGMCAPGDTFLSRRLPFVYACPRVSVAALALGIRPAMCFCCGGCLRYTPAISGLLRRLPSIRARRCVSVAAFCPRYTPAVCRMATNRTACAILRFCSARVEIAISAFSDVLRLSDFVGSLWACAFLGAISTETPKKSRRRPESLLGGGQALNRSHIIAP